RQRVRHLERAACARDLRGDAAGVRPRAEVRLAAVQRCVCRIARCGAPARSAILRAGEGLVSRHPTTSTTRKEHVMAGQPVHLEIAAKDSSRAQEFYKNLFGWEFQAFGGPEE